MAKASGPCAAIRAPRLIDATQATSGSSSSNPLNASLAPIRNIEAVNPQPVAVVADLSQNLIQEADSFANQFETYIVLNPNESSIDEFDKLVAKFSNFLFEANNRLPGPQNPVVHCAFYRKRMQGHRNFMDRQYRESSNPQRATKRQAQRTRDKYHYDMAQWQYANQRRKVANRLLNSSNKAKISIEIDAIENHFRGIFETANNSVRESYDPGSDQNLTPFSVALDSIKKSIKSIAIDTSPGVDGIVLRTI